LEETVFANTGRDKKVLPAEGQTNNTVPADDQDGWMDRSDFHRHRMVAESLMFRTKHGIAKEGRLPLAYMS
jgi:hypothetical protein